jgi:hypothetical protein
MGGTIYRMVLAINNVGERLRLDGIIAIGKVLKAWVLAHTKI